MLLLVVKKLRLSRKPLKSSIPMKLTILSLSLCQSHFCKNPPFPKLSKHSGNLSVVVVDVAVVVVVVVGGGGAVVVGVVDVAVVVVVVVVVTVAVVIVTTSLRFNENMSDWQRRWR